MNIYTYIKKMNIYIYRYRYRYRYGLDLFFNYGGQRSPAAIQSQASETRAEIPAALVGWRSRGAPKAALKFLHVREVRANLSVLVAAQHQLIGTPILYRCALCFSW